MKYAWIVALGVVSCAPLRRPEAGSATQVPSSVHATESMATLDELMADADELWVMSGSSGLARGLDRMSREELGPYERAENVVPGTGGLFAERDDGLVLVPLVHTDVDGRVVADVASVRVRQSYENPFDEPIEAIYVFPLPTNAAVTDFLMTIGERTIRGVVREREEAEKLYAAAKRQGIAASLLSQERPNVFTQRVANLAARAGIDVTLEYVHTLPWRQDAWELVFPMVVGPRYHAGAETCEVARRDGSRVDRVPYLRPDRRSTHDLSLAFEVAGDATLGSATHELTSTTLEGGRARVELAAGRTIPNRDLVLRLQPPGDGPRAELATQTLGDDGYFRLTLVPPAATLELPEKPLELVLLVDASGSMDGEPFELARDALVAALESLRPDDRFRVVRFSIDTDETAATPQPATKRNVSDALRFVRGIQAAGGTEMLGGLRAALRHPADLDLENGRERVVALLSDGLLDNEEQILREVRAAAGHTRFFSFGIGGSPNRFLLDTLAREGRGAVAYVDLEDDPVAPMERFLLTLRRPVLTDVELDWGTLAVREVYPGGITEMLPARPLQLVGRFDGAASAPAVRLRGRLGDVRLDVPVAAAAPLGPDVPVASLWARAKIADLASRARGATGHEARGYLSSICDVALEHGLVSSMTSFLAIDTATRVEAAATKSVPVALPVPEGMRDAR